MRKVIQLTGRLIIALLALIILLSTLVIVNKILVMGISSKDILVLSALSVPSLASISIPAILITIFSTRDAKSKRLWTAVKSIVIVVVIYVLWVCFVLEWLNSEFVGSVSSQWVFAIWTSSLILFTFWSAALTAHWLPSLRSTAIGTPPASIKYFEMLMFLYLGLLFLQAIFLFYNMIQAELALSENAALNMNFSKTNLIVIFGSSFLINLYLTVKVSKSGSKSMRSVLSVLYVTGVIFAMPAIAHLLVVNKLAGLFQVVLWIVSGCALYMAHTPESNSWIDGNAVPSKSYDTFL